ncbi:MAG: transposase [Bacteroidota bacterium]
MKYDPLRHHRRSLRLKGYDYSQAGLYFITICCKNMTCRFGDIKNNEMVLNKNGQIAYDKWVALPERFENVELDVFQIMPNHMHGIIILNDVRAGLAPVQNTNSANIPGRITQNTDTSDNPGDLSGAGRAGASPTPTIGDIVGAYKSLVANGCLDIYKKRNEIMGKLWQRDYYEHIIRNENAYHNISNYIINNPRNWNGDKFHRP